MIFLWAIENFFKIWRGSRIIYRMVHINWASRNNQGNKSFYLRVFDHVCMRQSFCDGHLLGVDKPPSTCITYNFYIPLTMFSIYKITWVKDIFKFIQPYTSDEDYFQGRILFDWCRNIKMLDVENKSNKWENL